MQKVIAGNQPEFRATSISKSERDVADLKRHARFAIVLQDTGEVELITNDTDSGSERQTVPLIAVVAKVEFQTQSFWASMAEIGCGRTRPYKRVHFDRNKILLQHRHPAWQLSAQQLQLVYPTILECLETVLIETRSGWKSDEPWFAGGQFYEKGVRITVSHADRLLCQAMLKESVRYFYMGIFSRSVDWINWKLRYSKFAVYTKRQYGQNVRDVASKVFQGVFISNPFWLEVLLQHVAKRRLLENALLHLHEFLPQQSVELDIAFGQPSVDLPPATGLFLWHTLDQPNNKKGSHADNCSRFEVIFDRKNPNSRFAKDSQVSKPVTNKEVSDDPDDCPF